ncbi:MAG: hypothetical protein OXE50_16115, partial [Chloroflexi bacterium]|nr:hypothetical protein [Chloroflexota bacterium]
MSKLILFKTPANDGQKVFISGTTTEFTDRLNNNDQDKNFSSDSNAALDFMFVDEISMAYVYGENIDSFSLQIDDTNVPITDTKKVQYGDTDFILVQFNKTSGSKATLTFTREDTSEEMVLIKVYLLNPFMEFEDPKFSQID